MTLAKKTSTYINGTAVKRYIVKFIGISDAFGEKAIDMVRFVIGADVESTLVALNPTSF